MDKLFANWIWIFLPKGVQKIGSRLFSFFFKTRLSRFFIYPYGLYFGLTSDYLNQFQPASDSGTYHSYSEFFRRKFKSTPKIEAKNIWPCEGYVCDWGAFVKKNFSVIKGQQLNLNSIFRSDEEATKDHFFLNIFLHNHNYHRVHSPVCGEITQITQIPGDLIFLRPWFYKRTEVSYPAFRNERYVFEILDQKNKIWHLAMIGGFGVGTIDLASDIKTGSKVFVGQELGSFNLGSTVCLAIPEKEVEVGKYLQEVHVGKELKIL